ncbi:MAG: hypothetical protein JXQ29_11430 [Planctomycetes bacterium]|nr:hypothetical protein [Planctomycetota bacterium]
MRKDVRVRCPGCRREFVVDTHTGQVIRDLKKPDKPETLFDGALDKVKEHQKGSEDRFERALESQEKRQAELEDAFDEAGKKAKDDPDEKPYNPMDWD